MSKEFKIQIIGSGPAGISPTVKTEEIEGGNRVTFTDKNGEHSIDVMNGVGGGGSGEAGSDGATFIPAVSDDGTLSWSNDKELENPAPVNIMGPAGKDGKDGEKGDPFTYDDFTPEQLEALKGKDGETGPAGKDGINGADGKTPEKGVDYFTDADKEELVNAVLEALPMAEGGAF